MTAKDFKLYFLELLFQLGHFKKYGILSYTTSTVLIAAKLAQFRFYKPEDYLEGFMTIQLEDKFSKAVDKAIEHELSEPSDDIATEHYRVFLNSIGDEYLKDFDTEDAAEADPAYEDAPEYSGWGLPCYLMSEERLIKELDSGDWRRLLHRTPYRPMTYKPCGRDLFDR